MPLTTVNNQKTIECEDDIKAMLKCKVNSYTRMLLNPLLWNGSVYALHNCCASCLLDYLKSWIESISPIPEFSGNHCRLDR